MPITPGLQLPYGIQPVNALPVDSLSGPFTGSVDTVASAITAANAGINSALRFKSMEVRLLVGGKSRKFWYKDGISDGDLVEFVGGNGGFTEGDVYFYVSGTTGGSASSKKSLFGGDTVISGTLFARGGISGSHTTLADGRSFLVAGSNVTITSASDGQITIASTGGGGGGPTYFTSVINNEIFTTGSLVASGSLTVKDGSGNSVFAASTTGLITAGRAQLSGTSGITGSLVIQNDLSSTAQLTLSSSTGFSTFNQTSGGDLEMRNTALGGLLSMSVKTSTGNTVNFMTVRPNGAAVSTLISLLPGIYAGPANPTNSSDTNFFVGGTVGSRGGSTRGTAVFGGDLLISGTVYTPTGLTVTGTVNVLGDILPNGDRVQNLGSQTQRWANVFTGDLHLRNDRGDYTLIEEEDFLSIRFNKTGKRYKFLLEAVPELDEDPQSLS